MINILKKLFLVYCIFACTAFGAGYVFAGLETLGIIPPPPENIKEGR